jgi:hypothetical protein
MQRLLAFSSSLLLLLVVWAGCSATGNQITGASASGTGGSESVGGAGGESLAMSATGSGGSGPAAAHLKGKVVAPEGTIPIYGALVYVTATPPPPIPDGVYCDECVHLDSSIAFTTTKPDGSFDLGTNSLGKGYLVAQKGAFRRVRAITVAAGEQDVPKALTTMPSHMDKANGDDIPKIAIVVGAWDPIEIVLARMGLDAKMSQGPFGKTQVLSKDASAFAIYGIQNLGESSPYPSPITLLTTPSEIEKYHMVFIPCSGGSNSDPGSGPQCTGVFNYDAKVKTTIEGFVKKGGRVYASDWSYEYVRQIFPGFVSWKGEDQQIGSACMNGGGDQAAPPVDPDLAAWLAAQGQTLSTVKDAWTSIAGVHATIDTDAKGKPVSETPKVWVHADSDPATTSFKHGCGRVLYTTYHTQPTAEASAPLEPQALSLLYLILEIGVCVDDTIPG